VEQAVEPMISVDEGELTLTVHSEKPGRIEVLRSSRIVRNIIALGIAQCITWTSTSVLVVLLPRYFGDVNLGKFAAASFLVDLLGLLAELGIGAYVVRETAQGDSRMARQLALNAVAVRLALMGGAMVVALVAVQFLFDDPVTRMIFYVSLPAMALGTAYSSLGMSLRGLQEMAPLAWSDALSRPIYVAIVLVLLVSGYGVVEVAAVSAIPAIIALLINVRAFGKLAGLHAQIDLSLWRTLILGGMPFFVWQASLLVYGQIDLLLLSKMTTDAVVGWYALAYKLISIPVFVPTIVIGAVYPALSQAARRDTESFKPMAWSALRVILVATVPLALGTAVLSDKIVEFLGYPPEFRHSIPLITILALHMPLVSMTTIAGTSLFAMGSQGRWMRVGLAAAVLNPLLNVPLILLTQSAFENGAIGAAIATCITEAFVFCAGILTLPRTFFDRQNCLRALKILLAALIMLPPVWLARDFGMVLVPVAVGGLVYCLASLILGAVPIDDLRLIAHHRSASLADAESSKCAAESSRRGAEPASDAGAASGR
jgi:O-antigen/teichoic acid export membrane protein